MSDVTVIDNFLDPKSFEDMHSSKMIPYKEWQLI